MTRTARWAVLACCGVVVLLTAWYAGSRFVPQAPGPAPGSVRLGPESGEAVADYLARLPAAESTAYALVQFGATSTPADALGAVVGTQPVTAVFRVPFPRVQTALRFEPLTTAPTALDTARERAQRAASADAGRLTGRPGAVAAAEARVLADPACVCVVALLVRGEPAALAAVTAGASVRAVDPAPVDAELVELALSPLLPEQTDVAGPLPDDGPVPG